MRALALLASGRCPRAEEERPESSNIHPGVAGPWAGSVLGSTATREPLAPSSSPPRPWAEPCPLSRSCRRRSSPRDRGGNRGADSALGLRALQVQPVEGAGALLGSPPHWREAKHRLCGQLWARIPLGIPPCRGTAIPNGCRPKCPLGSHPPSNALASCL